MSHPYKTLQVWREADRFVKEVYKVLSKFPDFERYAMSAQLRRAAISVPLNIVEGNARGSKNDARRFMFIARGSLMESAYLLELSKDLGYITNDEYNKIEKVRNSVSYLLQMMIISLQSP